MSNFVVRVEMHGASETDYTNLHRAMERAGYIRYTTDASGKIYQLPTATYERTIPGIIPATVVRDEVLAIANGVRQRSWVLVNRYDDSAWCLRQVSAAAAA